MLSFRSTLVRASLLARRAGGFQSPSAQRDGIPGVSGARWESHTTQPIEIQPPKAYLHLQRERYRQFGIQHTLTFLSLSYERW